MCRNCHKPCHSNVRVVGSMLCVGSKCHGTSCHSTTRQGQLAVAILFSSCPVAAPLRAALKSIRKATCYKKKSAAVPNSVAMEGEGLARSLEKLEEQGVAVRPLTTDLPAFPMLRAILENHLENHS